jgi:hypothetical protein
MCTRLSTDALGKFPGEFYPPSYHDDPPPTPSLHKLSPPKLIVGLRTMVPENPRFMYCRQPHGHCCLPYIHLGGGN